MKKNVYYKTLYRRKNIIKEFCLQLFLALSSYPRMILEVFIRRNLGERYFSFATALTIFVLLMAIPAISSPYGFSGYSFEPWELLKENKLWYMFAVAFLLASYRRKQEIKRLPSVFDFGRFSLSGGLIHPFFRKLRFRGKFFTVRQIEIYLEPLLFLLIGLILNFMGQSYLSILFTLASIMYSLSYSAAYHLGDHFMMDQIDEMIVSEELANIFVEDADPSQTRGFTAYGRRPANPEHRRKLYEKLVGSDDETAHVL